MSEELKNSGKKLWATAGWFHAWLILVAVTFVVISIVTQFLPGGPRSVNDWTIALTVFFLASMVIATVFIGLWKFIRWLCCWWNVKRFLFGCACFATLIAFFYAEEDWRGWHAWNQFKTKWEAKGERFDWASIVPPTVPDEQNFAFSPVWIAEDKFNFLNQPSRAEAWYGNRIYSEEVSNFSSLLPVSVSGIVGTNQWRGPSTPENSGDRRIGKMTDLKAWQAYYRSVGSTNPVANIPVSPQPQTPAADVLLALSKFDPVIERLRQDSALPYSRFPIQYDTENPAMILLPHLAAEKRYVQLLRLRTVAKSQNGDGAGALEDVKLMLRLADLNRNEPTLISQLVRLAMTEITIEPIWEGLADHRWSDAELSELDKELTKMDFLANYKMAMHGEMVFCQDGIVNYLRRHPEELSAISDQNYGNNSGAMPLPARIVCHMIPSGWYYQNQLHCSRVMEEIYIPLANVTDHTVDPTSVARAFETLKTDIKHATPYNLLERMLVPGLENSIRRFAYTQSSVDSARVAIALERYRLAHGEYPETLDALAPQFIVKVPHDVINGGPLHYRREANGSFTLYSIGWNETDDGGVVVLKKGEAPTVDESQGDWVWRYPR